MAFAEAKYISVKPKRLLKNLTIIVEYYTDILIL